MIRLLRRAAGASCWPLLGAVVMAHGTLAVLAIAEYATLGWLLHTWFDLAAVTLVVASALAGLAASARVAARAAGGSRALRKLVRSARKPLPPELRSAAAALGIAGRLDLVRAGQPLAITYGLARPRILISDNLACTLSPAECSAVLTHERYHLRHRDPARLLAASLLAGYGCYLPAARWLAGRMALRRELAADHAAAASEGRGALAGALLKLASLPACPAVVAANPAGDPAASLEARVAQLEDGHPPRPRLGPGRALASAGGMAVLAAAGMCCVGLSQALHIGML